MSEADMESELLAKGWVRKNIIDEPRLAELKDTYESMGMEVRVEPVTPEILAQECDSCLINTPAKFFVLYVRESKDKRRRDDELFD